jgi:hypothetical protein
LARILQMQNEVRQRCRAVPSPNFFTVTCLMALRGNEQFTRAAETTLQLVEKG